MEYQNKVVLITGAASGIGRAAALAFSKEGAKVVVSDLNEEEGAATVKEIEASGGMAFFIKTDVSVYEDVANVVRKTVEKYGRLDVAINNAGISGELARTADSSLENWEKVMAINASGVFYGLKTQIPQMLLQGGGVILNTASIAGLRAMPNAAAYVASKHAVIGLTKTAAAEYARKNIRINALCPVFTITALFDPEKVEQFRPGYAEKLKAGIPMKRFAEVEEQVNAMLWICSEKASFVTGQAMSVDGGLTA